ncbi:putative pentatricopeptide repeat-containing protein [Acorus gramineus]|uniref:Pentatricopeptide repeat-containing protein n=1 Tax=Acorus gramineus TaxID=55184 RepID=A0AAV9BAL8_ACOGR|nr:putative pentatricopeptide repeat-containing protein [Acorus gramineus]
MRGEFGIASEIQHCGCMVDLYRRAGRTEEAMGAAAPVLSSNVYEKKGRWEGVRSVRGLMEDNRMKKMPGCSLVKVGGVQHEFFVGDESHPGMGLPDTGRGSRTVTTTSDLRGVGEVERRRGRTQPE